MNHTLVCRCGTVRGRVERPVVSSHAICYCTDCQAYGKFLGAEAQVLDAQGGTDIVATMPSHVRIEQGGDRLACVSLTEKGLLRWYAGCCNTPIGNTPPDRRIHYVGLVHNALAKPLEPSFGPVTMHLSTDQAHGHVKATPFAMLAVFVKLTTRMLPARLTGRYRDNPFFDAATGRPVTPRRVLTTGELAALKMSP